MEKPGLRKELEPGIVRRRRVPGHPAHEVVAGDEAPQRAVGIRVEPDEFAHLELLAAGRMIHLVGPKRVDDVAGRTSGSVAADCNPDGSVLLDVVQDVVEPQILGAVKVADAIGDELDVDRLDDVVPGIQAYPLDPAGAAVAVVEADVHGVHRVAPQDRRHRVAVALVDRRLRRPQRSHRLPRVAHGLQRLGVDAAHQPAAAVFGLGADGGHPGQRHRRPVGAHGERNGREARRQLAVVERAKRPLGPGRPGDEAVGSVPEGAAVDVAPENPELRHLFGGRLADFDAHGRRIVA